MTRSFLLKPHESDLVEDELVPPPHPSTQNTFDQNRFTINIVSATDLVTILHDGGRDTPRLKQLNEQFLKDVVYENENREVVVKEVVINAWCPKHNQSGSM